MVVAVPSLTRRLVVIKTLALEAKTIDGFKFAWFTDGKGWNSARNNLEETFDVLDDVYNINDLESGVIGRF